MKKLLGIILLTGLFLAFKSVPAHAASLTNLSDVITTSRPSAATPLTSNAAISATVLSITNNGSRFFASDSAKIMRTSTGANIVSSTIIASQSSALTTAYTTSGISAAAQAGTDVLIANITAMHTVSFINANPIPSGGKIIITYPGATNSSASPSATTFSFNGLTSANVKTNNASTCSWTITSPSITCTTNALISAGTTITFLIGCSSASGASCTTQAPTLINPIKTANAGTADTWNVAVLTQDSGGVTIDSGTTKVATIDTVQVQASVDSAFTFTIAGINNGTAINQGNSTGCTNSELTTSGFNASATTVNLGALPVSAAVQPNISAQLITITTNSANGYTLTATSSGQLMDDATGYAIASSTTPAIFPATTPWFGIHACGADVNTTTWGAANTTTTRGGTAKYGWPTQTTGVTLASNPIGPIAGSGGSGLTSTEYAAAVDATVPSGSFTTEITYVATPIF